MDDLIAWLRAQLAVDESDAHAFLASVPPDSGAADWMRQILVDVDAKLRILDRWAELHSEVLDALDRDDYDAAPTGSEFAYEQVAKELAVPYAALPGYREEWKP